MIGDEPENPDWRSTPPVRPCAACRSPQTTCDARRLLARIPCCDACTHGPQDDTGG